MLDAQHVRLGLLTFSTVWMTASLQAKVPVVL